MINFDELNKFIKKDSIITLVVMADGIEIGAVSFKSDTLAFKDVLKANSNINIATAIIDKPVSTPTNKVTNIVAKQETVTNVSTTIVDKSNTIKENVKPLTREQIMAQIDDEDDDSIDEVKREDIIDTNEICDDTLVESEPIEENNVEGKLDFGDEW